MTRTQVSDSGPMSPLVNYVGHFVYQALLTTLDNEFGLPEDVGLRKKNSLTDDAKYTMDARQRPITRAHL